MSIFGASVSCEACGAPATVYVPYYTHLPVGKEISPFYQYDKLSESIGWNKFVYPTNLCQSCFERAGGVAFFSMCQWEEQKFEEMRRRIDNKIMEVREEAIRNLALKGASHPSEKEIVSEAYNIADRLWYEGWWKKSGFDRDDDLVSVRSHFEEARWKMMDRYEKIETKVKEITEEARRTLTDHGISNPTEDRVYEEAYDIAAKLEVDDRFLDSEIIKAVRSGNPFGKKVEEIRKEAIDNLAKKGISSPSKSDIAEVAYDIAKDLYDKTTYHRDKFLGCVMYYLWEKMLEAYGLNDWKDWQRKRRSRI